MNRRTVLALNRINRRFYAERAEDFSSTRSAPWPGWKQVVEVWSSRGGSGNPDGPGAVLDVGCGNGRFGVFLERRLGTAFPYTGVDASHQLLEVARRRLTGRGPRHWVRHDLVEEGCPPTLPLESFSLIVLFGVLHHIPGFAVRRALLRELGRRLEPGGVLAFSVWQFAHRERFQSRVVPWADYNRAAEVAIDPAELEPGDVFLAWGSSAGEAAASQALPWGRYCHHADPDEVERLLAELSLAGSPVATLGAVQGLRTVMTFYGQGSLAGGGGGTGDELNFYVVLERPPRETRGDERAGPWQL